GTISKLERTSFFNDKRKASREIPSLSRRFGFSVQLNFGLAAGIFGCRFVFADCGAARKFSKRFAAFQQSVRGLSLHEKHALRFDSIRLIRVCNANENS